MITWVRKTFSSWRFRSTRPDVSLLPWEVAPFSWDIDWYANHGSAGEETSPSRENLLPSVLRFVRRIWLTR